MKIILLGQLTYNDNRHFQNENNPSTYETRYTIMQITCINIGLFQICSGIGSVIAFRLHLRWARARFDCRRTRTRLDWMWVGTRFDCRWTRTRLDWRWVGTRFDCRWTRTRLDWRWVGTQLDRRWAGTVTRFTHIPFRAWRTCTVFKAYFIPAC